MSVTPTLWVRPRQGPKLADLIAEPNTTRAHGDSDVVDILGSAYAATDGDPATAWTAPQRVVQHKSPPTLTLTLPRPTEVAGLRLAPSRSTLPAHPTVVAVNLGDGPQVRELKRGRATNRCRCNPRVTDTVTVSLLDWEDVIDRNALGFDQLKPPGLAEVAVLGTDGNADRARRRHPQPVARDHVGCEDSRARSSRSRAGSCTPRSAPRWARCWTADPVAALPCERDPIALPAGQQELLISPGAQFVVDGAQLSTPAAARITQRLSGSAAHGGVGPGPPRGAGARVAHLPGAGHSRKHQPRLGGAHQHRGPVDAGRRQRVAAGLGGARGDPGTITLTFASNSLYRAGLAVGLALLPLLAVLALWRTRRGRADDAPAQPWAPGRWAAVAVLAAGAVIAGAVGVVVVGAALGLRYALRHRQRWRDGMTVGLSAGGLILAGAALSRHPWRSVDGYAGHSANVQLLALISLAVLAASVVTMPDREPRPRDE